MKSFTFNTIKEKRKVFLDEIVNFIKSNNINLEITDFEFNLILDETITNAMEHGNKWDSNKKIYVSISYDDKYLYIKIRDEGSGFDYNFYLSKDDDKTNLNPRGRGLKIINQFAQIKWNKKGNEITLKIKRA